MADDLILRRPMITEYLYGKAALSGVPLSGTFELTPVCNMDCKMCYVRMSKEAQEKAGVLKTADEWLALAEEAKREGMLYLLLTGGEPFLHPQFREILTGLKQMGFIVSINSNGTMIDEETVEWLKDAAPARINISLYGANDETYSMLCGNPKGFSQTDRAIRLLCDAGITVKINCSITPYNVKDLPAMIAYAQELGVNIQPVAYMFPPLRKNSEMVGKNHRFTPKEAAFVTAYIEYLLMGKERFLASSDESVFLPVERDSCMEIGDGIRCNAGKCSFWVTWDGKMMPCGMFPSDRAENVFELGLKEAWKQVKKEVKTIRLPGQCAGCAIKDQCRACAAIVITESGCFDRVPEYRCKMMMSYPEQRRVLKARIEEGEI